MNLPNRDALIKQMQQPDFYPHAVSEPIKQIQTHVSSVFLTGDYAYKLKKAVNFGFLDFSTLKKRQHFLDEEIRLNNTLAPDLYLEVLPITSDGEHYQLGGDGEAVEYVLKMRAFAQENLFINLFEADRLNIEQMEELGKVVAEFHRSAATNDYISSFGEVEQVRVAFDENYEQSQKYIGMAQTQQQWEETKAWSDRAFAEKQDLFQTRIQQGKIRECHGDLHLKNICLWQDKILLFDRIEFNEPFRFVDVMYDVAFAVMDLQARGRDDFANAFLDTYLEYTGDWEGLQVLPLYLSRQAYVRAKVTSFLLDDPDVPETEKQQAVNAAADYYRLAWQYTQPTRGKLWVMSGISGTGKTTVAKEIARKTNAILIRSDAVRKHLAGISLDQRGDDSIYSPEMSQKTYQRLIELGSMLVKGGYKVILDAKFDRQQYRQAAIEAAQSADVPVQIIHCTAPIEILKQRLEARKDISDATADLLPAQQRSAEEFTPQEKPLVVTIDTSKSEWQNNLIEAIQSDEIQ